MIPQSINPLEISKISTIKLLHASRNTDIHVNVTINIYIHVTIEIFFNILKLLILNFEDKCHSKLTFCNNFKQDFLV